ncbi:MAG TPA: hypothetical protein VGQ93_13245 [Lysobacter sp.]|jgi:hypothetical protein|nr:hypothetical protein [Lysobacter sp.]
MSAMDRFSRFAPPLARSAGGGWKGVLLPLRLLFITKRKIKIKSKHPSPALPLAFDQREGEKEKAETPLTPMPRSQRAVHAAIEAVVHRQRCSLRDALGHRPVRLKDAGPATSPLRYSITRKVETHRIAKHRTERFLEWDFRPDVMA